MRRFTLLVAILVLATIGTLPAFAQQTAPQSTPDPQAILNRAEEAASLAKVTAEMNQNTIELVRNLAWFFGIIVGIATVILALLGFETRRGFKDTMQEFKAELTQLKAESADTLKEYRGHQEQVQSLEAALAERVQEINGIREKLARFRKQVRQDFDQARQALVLTEFANQLFNQGQEKRQQAIDAYEQARRLQPDDAEINYRLGNAYGEAGRYEDAIELLKKALEKMPNHPEANMVLGLTYRRQGDAADSAEERLVKYKLAEHYYKEAIRLRPAYEDALAPLGGLYRRLERYQEALDYYRRAAAVDPGSSYALGNMASLSWYLGQIARARYYFERVEQVADDRIKAGRAFGFWDLYDRALARLALGKRADAMTDYEAAIARTPVADNLRSVLNNLDLLSHAPTPIEGLNDVIEMIKKRIPSA